MTFWWEHNGGKSYDTSHLIESIKRRNVNRQSASKYVTRLFKFTSIRLHDYYSQFNDHDRSNRLCVTRSTWLTYSPNSNRGKLKITQLQSQSSREKMLFSQTECQQARGNPFDLSYIRFSPVFAVLVSSVAPTAPWTVTSPSGRQSSNSSRGLCPAARRTGRHVRKQQQTSK